MYAVCCIRVRIENILVLILGCIKDSSKKKKSFLPKIQKFIVICNCMLQNKQNGRTTLKVRRSLLLSKHSQYTFTQ